MKWIINGFGDYADALEYKRDHDLGDLWRVCREIFAALGADGDDAIDPVGNVVAEFAALDKRSFAFRYATAKDGSEVVLPRWSLDLENLRDVMAGVENFFVGVDGYLEAQTWAISDSRQYS